MNTTDPAQRLIMLAFILLVMLTLAYYTPRIVSTLETSMTQAVKPISE
jgi:hypothetical protein